MRWKVALAMGLLLVAGAPRASAQELQQIPGTPSPPLQQRRPSLSETQRQQIRQWQQEIHRLETETQQWIQSLQTRGPEALASDSLQRLIAQRKRDTHLRVLRLRRKIAELRGDTRQLRELDSAIRQAEHPGIFLKPPKTGPRPIPSTNP